MSFNRQRLPTDNGGTGSDTVTVKLKFASKLRRVKVTLPLDKPKIYRLLNESNYPEYKGLLTADDFDEALELSFCDDEGDIVSLSDPRDFVDALDVFKQEQKIPCFIVEFPTQEENMDYQQERHTYIQIDIHAYRKTYIHTGRHTYIQKDIHTYIQKDIHRYNT